MTQDYQMFFWTSSTFQPTSYHRILTRHTGLQMFLWISSSFQPTSYHHTLLPPIVPPLLSSLFHPYSLGCTSYSELVMQKISQLLILHVVESGRMQGGGGGAAPPFQYDIHSIIMLDTLFPTIHVHILYVTCVVLQLLTCG